MEIHNLKKANQKSKAWSGGETTELFIWPAGSDYGRKDFDFRISTATVEVDESVFTPLPGIRRTLMVLTGKMRLEHENQHEKSLTEFGVDRFDGGWNTHSFGRCIDFNVMTRNGAQVELEGISLTQNEEINHDLPVNHHIFIYLFEGSIALGSDDEQELVEKGDFVRILPNQMESITARAAQSSKIVWIFIEK